MRQNSLVKKTYRTLLALTGAAMLSLLPVAAEAAPITYPDITSWWNAGQVALSYVGFNSQYNDGTSTVSFDDAGSFAVTPGVGGNITITGEFTPAGASSALSGSLLSGTITSVLFDTAQVYDFLFNIDSGVAAHLFGGVGATGRTIMSDWSYGERMMGTADTFAHSAPVPEPATLSLMLAGGSALVASRRRRASSQA